MIKDRLRDLNIKLTELSDYLKVSRPTLYKYFESYDSGNYRSLRPEIVKLFKYIEDPATKKEQALAYMITISTHDYSDSKDVIRGYLLSPTATEAKIDLIAKVISTGYLDEVLPYISNCLNILSSETINDEQLHQVARMVVLKSKVTKNVPLSSEELEEAKILLKNKYKPSQ